MRTDTSATDSLEVSWGLDSTTVHGTLVVPSGPGPHPAAVMIAGSGPTDRDWNSPMLSGTNGSARLIAEELANAGIASLRYDKRASGPHVQENMQALAGKLSMQSHLDELDGAVRTLAAREDIRSDRIFAIGNSEGTLHAVNYQVQNPAIPLAGIVLIAPPGRPVSTVAHTQVAEQMSAVPNGEALLALYDAAMARFLAGEPAAPDPALPQGIQMLFQALEANLPFSRELMAGEAVTPLGQVDVPVLIVIGKKDVQVDWQADGEPLQRAASRRANVTILFPENANHVLKHEARPRGELVQAEMANGYNAPDARLDEDGMAAILEWLQARI
jgi:alpha-beta hydrolase superfamily lysophospholipase